ncbi:MAG: phosphotransferase [Gemmatimonadota bacterium]|nr:phosphotransferase [Gemmatimonadota bacterium]
MVIHEYYGGLSRRVVGFLDEDPPDGAISSLAGYQVRRLGQSDLEDSSQLAGIAAIVFRQQPRSPYKIKRDLERHAETLLWHDCRVFVQVPQLEPGSGLSSLRTLVFQAIEERELPSSGLGQIEEESPLTPKVHVFSFLDTWSEIATYLRQYPPGEPPSLALEIIDGNNDDLAASWSPEKVKLVQRAFHDCIKVTFIENSAGLSGVHAYKAYAMRKGDYVGKQTPYEYFVKIGDRQKISQEFLAYRDIALEHIPFHLGPRLRLDRCALGTELGVIVSDYVSGAENLIDCARAGRGVPAIASLFNTTLRAWRENSKRSEFRLQDFLEEKMPDEIPEHRRESIEALGDLKEPTELESLLTEIPPGLIQVGVVHGDLHAMNVLVRGGDAILIDFEKIEKSAPLLFDYASVEAGLLVSGFIGDMRTGSKLLKSIEKLYERDALVRYQFSPCHPSDASAWFFDCARQIRMQARQIEHASTHYAYILAVVLIKKACNIANFSSSAGCSGQSLDAEQMRALAYVLGERILLGLSSTGEESSAK